MTREQAKKLIPIIQAFAEGKTIQFFSFEKKWVDREYPAFDDDPSNYRIKPEPKYRPFKNVEECWNETQKHQPVGWLKGKTSLQFYSFYEISENSLLDYRFNNYTFADGTPYGIKE